MNGIVNALAEGETMNEIESDLRKSSVPYIKEVHIPIYTIAHMRFLFLINF